MKGYLAGVDIERLKEKTRQGPSAALWRRLKSRTAEIIAAARRSDFHETTGSLGWHSCTPSTLAAALLYRLEGDQSALRYIEECIRVVDARAREHKKQVDGKSVKNTDSYNFIHSHAEIAEAADMLRDALSEDARRTLFAFMRDVAIDMRCGREGFTYYGGGNNISWCQSARAAQCALLWGEESGHPGWRDAVEDGINHTRCYLKYGCDEAGYSFEGTGYGHAVFHIMFDFVELLKRSGYSDLYKTEPRLREILESALKSLFPDRRFLTNDNDIGLAGAGSMSYLLYGWREYGDPLYLGLWHEYQGPDHPVRPYGDMEPWSDALVGRTKASLDPFHSLFHAFLYWEPDAPWTPIERAQRPTADFSPGVGKADFRTSWGPDAVYLNVLGAGRSNMSQTHRHADAGHFSLFAHGDYLAVDTGRYNSDEDQHNVVLVDGACWKPVAPGWGMDVMSGRMDRFEHTPLLSTVRVDMAHEKNCCWATRAFLFVPFGGDAAYVVVIDNINKDNAKHDFWWQLQANPDYRLTIDGDNRAAVHGERARLDMTFVILSREDYPNDPYTLKLRQDIKEWQWPYGREQDTTEIEKGGLLCTSVRRPRLVAEMTGLNGNMMAVLSPRRKGEPPLKIRLPQQKRLLQAEIDTGDYIDTVIAALDHGFIETETLAALTEIAFVRRDRAGHICGTWTVDGAPIRIKK